MFIHIIPSNFLLTTIIGTTQGKLVALLLVFTADHPPGCCDATMCAVTWTISRKMHIITVMYNDLTFITSLTLLKRFMVNNTPIHLQPSFLIGQHTFSSGFNFAICFRLRVCYKRVYATNRTRLAYGGCGFTSIETTFAETLAAAC